MTNSELFIPEHIPEKLVFDYDIYCDERLDTQNLHHSYAEALKDAPPVFFTPRNGGHWVASRYDELKEILVNAETFSNFQTNIPAIENPPILIPLTLDPPHNTPFRKALMPAFSPKSVNESESVVRSWAVKIIEELADRGECDFLEEVASLFPVTVFMELMGMDIGRLREFREVADSFFKAEGQEEVSRVSGEIIGLLTELIEQKQCNPDSSLTSQLLQTQVGERPISMEELQNMCFLLFLGGMDTVTNLATFSFKHLAADPALQARLAGNIEDVPKFVEEAVRCFGVVNTRRVLTRDERRFGIDFKKGDLIFCALPLAGWDDKRNVAPAIFDIDRPKKDYLTFASGAHLCVGHFLARLELRVLVEEWLKRIPGFSLQSGAELDVRLGQIFAPRNLPLVW